MLQTKQLTLAEQIKKAKQHLLSEKHHINVSLVEKIDPIHPIDFFAAYKNKAAQRFFWKDQSKDFYIVGIGKHHSFEAEGNDRFSKIKSNWNEYIKSVVIEGEVTQGTGPMILGGFSFNDTINSEEWQSFKPGMMILPKAMLSVYGDEYYMTYNLTINHETNVDEAVERLHSLKQVPSTLSKPQTLSTESTESVSFKEWDRQILETVEKIKKGHMNKVVLARQLIAQFNDEITIQDVLTRLVEQQIDSYIYVFDRGEQCFISATPERLVKVEGEELLSTCLAGTISRGETDEEDESLAWTLLHDRKNLNEHQYVVDMIKEAIEPFTESMNVPGKPVIYPLRSLQHLYTPVKAKLKQTGSIIDIIEKLHPTPAMGGEPRESAIKYIQEHEPFERGWYASPIGWIDHQGNGEFAVAIRSALIKNSQATLYAGCGIVEQSDSKAEFDETNLKFNPMLEALGGNS